MIQSQKFSAALVAEKFKNASVKFDKILAQVKHPEITAIRKKFRDEVKEYSENGIISVAFVGQYNAGKSTTISALTGRRDIKIDSDIATDVIASYDWNGIKLIDTPGLFTDREDHDEITYEAINKADLLVFSLTYMLFDAITVENFKKLAYEKGYRWKMVLLINKMSDEAGEEAQKIANYRQSLAEALKPDSLDEFPVCFIDAKDYCEGVDQKEDFLIEISRFQTFIDALNNFVERRGALARFDTPVRIVLASVDEAQLSFTRNSNQDTTFLEVLTQLSRAVRKERESLRTKIYSIALEMSSFIAKEGITLAAAVGTEQDFNALNKQSEINIQQHYEKAETKLQYVVNTAVEDIREKVAEVLNGNLVQTFITCLSRDLNVSAKNVDSGGKTNLILGQVNWLRTIGETAGVQLKDLATRGFLNSTGVFNNTGLLRSWDVMGSGLHQTILAVGKSVGFKFKPWQAVGIAKNIGNAAIFLGPALSLLAVATDAYSMHQEKQREQKMADIRRDITSQFQSIAKDLENQIHLQLWEFEQQVYGEIDKQIAAARQQEESAIASSNAGVKQLAEIRQDFELILSYITKATENLII
ncbi:GTPase [Calothrix sp. PCC 7507]|uniref:GTPase n=1 Tax=Calothrix sp. PCC 7507 TaxID=99598 RepID=UPI00029EFB79|nr:GTPase [Calothrix sp. PCC 7507]AFY32861.1 GTP-binding protein HSR1-related protein [Calothrix sp. PCC 7507]